MRSLLWALPLFLLAGCSTWHEAGNGRVNVTVTTEERSPFGTNMGFARVENCKAEKAKPGDIDRTLSECNPVTGWTPMYSQGQGGQIVGGALNGLGFGLGAAFGGASSGANATSSSSASSAASAVSGGKGH